MPVTLKSRFPQIIAGLDPRVNAATKAGAEVIKEAAKVRVPDAPPQGEGLVDAIEVHSTEDVYAGAGTEGGWLVVAGDSDHFYGHMLEFGTSHSAAKPFLIPATEESKPEVVALVSAALKTL